MGLPGIGGDGRYRREISDEPLRLVEREVSTQPRSGKDGSDLAEEGGGRDQLDAAGERRVEEEGGR